MTLQTCRVDEVAAQPWRNGGGVTRELLTWPGAQAWGLRISVADVERDGPFSAFAGVERFFTVLDGAGVMLDFADSGETCRVTQADAPLRFDGGRPVHCRLIDGPTRDLNVMVATKRGTASCVRADAASPPQRRAALTAVFAQDAATLVHPEGSASLPPMTLAWSSDSAAGKTWRLRESGRTWWIAFDLEPRR